MLFTCCYDWLEKYMISRIGETTKHKANWNFKNLGPGVSPKLLVALYCIAYWSELEMSSYYIVVLYCCIRREGGYPSNFLYYLQMSCSGNGRANRILSEYKRILIQIYLQNTDPIFLHTLIQTYLPNAGNCQETVIHIHIHIQTLFL